MSKKKKNSIKFLGMTPDKRLVFGGAFKMHDTIGFSLADSMMAAEKLGGIISMPDFVEDAVEAGWPLERAIAKVEESFSDCGRWQEFADQGLEARLYGHMAKRVDTVESA